MKLLIIDPDISLVSPSMKGIIRSFPEIRAAGFEIEVWCWRCDEGIDPDRVVRLPTFGARLLRPLQGFVFAVQVTLRAFWLFTVCGRPRADITYSVVPYLADCDVAHGHFSPWDWEARMRILGSRTVKEWLERGVNWIGKMWTENFLRRTRASVLIVPSDAVAADFRRVSPASRIVVLPNSYDPRRFNLNVRERWRTSQRDALGHAPGDRVFLFVSTGHYRRKGFFLAVAAVRLLRTDHPEARLLVVGGRAATLKGLTARLNAEFAGWEEWIHFAGSTSEPEKFMAAADAFLFPSYSEALALVEIEAAACGLPLFLTPHHGSEMILEDGVNGLRLEFDAASIAATLTRFLNGTWAPEKASLKHALDHEAYAAGLVKALRGSAARTEAAHRTLESASLPP